MTLITWREIFAVQCCQLWLFKKAHFIAKKAFFGMFQNVISSKWTKVKCFAFKNFPQLINLFACEEKSPHAYFSDKYVGFSSQASGFFCTFVMET